MGSCVCNSKRALGATGRPERTETASFRPCSADSDSGALGIGRYALCRTSGRLSPATRRKSGCFCRGGLTRGASGSDLDCTRASGGGNSTRDPHGGGGGETRPEPEPRLPQIWRHRHQSRTSAPPWQLVPVTPKSGLVATRGATRRNLAPLPSLPLGNPSVAPSLPARVASLPPLMCCIVGLLSYLPLAALLSLASLLPLSSFFADDIIAPP